MSPKLREGEYVFAVLTQEQVETLNPMLLFEEEEGKTVVITKAEAEARSIHYDAVWNLITLTVHSDLQAVGLLAAVSNKLAEAGISINVVSAFYHDHLFVLPEKANEAMRILEQFPK